MKSPFDLSYQNQNADARIVAALERIAQAFRVLLWQEGVEHALTPIQLQVLIFLHYHAEAQRKITIVSQELNVTKATLSETVKILQRKGLIRKVLDPEDSRSTFIQLTAKGRQLAERASKFAAEVQKPIAQITEESKKAILGALLQIIRHLNEAGVITVQRMCFTCRYYTQPQPNKHFCQLLNTALKDEQLRIDCPEHQSAAV
ncbi:MAG: hypothetical protein KatS3mg031_1474 [Chitinophagales bacterium]|nr:MAG: hypothetical protein KatS3mg031_1474 [Chitinophagales bacterium]